MVERVGIAICNALYDEAGLNIDRYVSGKGFAYHLAARAAIEAMRDLTDEMEFAGGDGSNWAFRFQWERAIDAALQRERG
jgi:hypothetical protein